MAQIEFVSFAEGPEAQTHSRITQLLPLTLDGEVMLFSATRYDGVLQHWQISASGLSAGDQISYSGTLAAGGTGSLTALKTTDGVALLTGGGDNGNLQQFWLDPGGSISASTALPHISTAFQTLQSTSVISLGQSIFVYGALGGEAGIGVIQFGAVGAVTSHFIHDDPTFQTMTQISATAIALLPDQAYLITASALQNGLASRSINADGTLGAPVTFGTADGLWINAPEVMETINLNGKTFVILGAAGSHSLSVLEVGPDGGLTLRDHVLDSRDTRFGGIAALEVVEREGVVFVIAGGADDGISVFVLLDSGLLIHRAAFEDTVDISLNNVSAIAGLSGLSSSGLDIFVASSRDLGLTQLRYDPGPVGGALSAGLTGATLVGGDGFDILQGHNGNDTLIGAGGDDILHDGRGTDILTGGAGADLFLLSYDNTTDTITDFTFGEDRIDLSLWPLLRDISQLTFTLRTDGMEIRYGAEILIVQSADGATIDYRKLQSSDVIGADRLASMIEPGFPGPPRPTPDLQSDPDVLPPPAAYDPINPHALAAGVVLGQTAGLDATIGTNLADQLTGTELAELVLARRGNDLVDVKGGDDVVLGGDGDDQIFGGAGADLLLGGDGDDLLSGGFGDDLLGGGGGADHFIFNEGDDIIDDFTLGQDRLTLDPRLWTGLTSAQDLLMVYGSTDGRDALITFETGDSVTLLGITDLGALGFDIDLF